MSSDRSSDPRFPEERHVLEGGCDRCPSLVACRTRIAWGNGPADADVFVVGEAPAAGNPNADRWRGGNLTGLAYTSRHSGRRIRRLIDACGYAGRTYYTNAVKCFPRDRDAERETNREPTAEERRRCRVHLRAELRSVDPEVVCPTGRHATAAVLETADATIDDVADGFLETVLEPIDVGLPTAGDRGGSPDVLPLLHPSYRDVWAPRIGYENAEAYRMAVERALDRATA